MRYQRTTRLLRAAALAALIAISLFAFRPQFILDCSTSWDILCWFV